MLRLIFGLAVFVLVGCQSSAPELPDIEPVAVPVIKTQTKLPPSSPLPPAIPLAIVVSANVPAYLDVENALTKRLDAPYRVFNLDERTSDEILDEMRRIKIDSFVAIGVQALGLVSGYSEEIEKDTKIVYSQIFNPVQNTYRGVAAIPPMAPQLKYWAITQPGPATCGCRVECRL